MPSIKQTLSFLILGQTGGKNRVQIIDLLKERAYNTNQLAEKLHLNYRTIKHHIDVLLEHNIITTVGNETDSSTYGNVFFLSPEMEENIEFYNVVVRKLADIADSPHFFQNIVEQINDGIIIIDNGGISLYWNRRAEILLGYERDDVLGTPIKIFEDEKKFQKMVGNVINKREITNSKITNYIATCNTKSGDTLDVDITITDFKNDQGKINGLCLLLKGIT